MSEKHKKMCRVLNYFKHFLFFISVVSGVSISAFASLAGIPVGIGSSAVGLKICGITAGIKKYKLIIKKKRQKNDKIVLPGKAKLDTIDVLISKALIDSCISQDEFVSVNNLLREYSEMKEEIKNPQNAVDYAI